MDGTGLGWGLSLAGYELRMIKNKEYSYFRFGNITDLKLIGFLLHFILFAASAAAIRRRVIVKSRPPVIVGCTKAAAAATEAGPSSAKARTTTA